MAEKYEEALKRIAKAKQEKRTRLDLDWLGLTALPDPLFELVHLKELDISLNELTEIPHAISRLKNLEVLHLEGNPLTEWPVEIGNLAHLTYLNSGDNRLQELPAGIGNLAQLTYLNLYYNKLKKLPSEIGNLVQLTDLNLGGNQLQKLPPEIGNLTQLTYLNLYGNQLKKVPSEIGNLAQLTDLYLGDNQFEEFPVEIGNLTQLTKLDLRGNQLQKLPTEIRNLAHLNKLDLSSNSLHQIPSDIVHLNELENLYIWGNRLTKLPDKISQLEKLKELDLSINQLSAFPLELLEIKGLTGLYLHNNNIKELPLEINQLKNLEELSLGNLNEKNMLEMPLLLDAYKKNNSPNNEIASLPPAISQLKNLSYLFLSNLQLNRLPTGMPNFKGFKGNDQTRIIRANLIPILHKNLALEGNRFDIAEEMYDKEPAELIQYLLDLEKGKKPLHEAKIIFVGNGDVGKTSLVNRLKFNRFDEKESQTNGIVIEDWQLHRGMAKIKLHLWDFGGQQIMHASHQFFMTRRSVYVLVIEPRTEDKHGDTALDYWLTLIRSYAGDSPVVVVLNKCEDNSYIDMPKRELKIKYPQIKDFVETSCKIPRNIDKVKEALTSALRDMKHLDDNIPASYFAVKEKLQKINSDYIDFDQYKQICRDIDPGISENAMKVLVRLLNDLGIMLNIPEHRRLEETQVLNPGWLTNGVYQIITSSRLKDNRGRISFKEIETILGGPRNKGRYRDLKARNIIMDMMEHFKLCYSLPTPDNDCYLIPAALPLDSPASLQWQPIAPLRFQYQYKTLPAGIIANLIVRLLPHKRGNDYWRSGIIILHDDGKNQALIRADHYRHILSIEVGGSGNKRNTLSYIRTTLDIIHNGYSREDIAPRGLVPLDEKGEVTISYEDLLVMEEEKIENHYVAALRKYINVKEVLDGIRPENELSHRYLEELADKISRDEIDTVINVLYHHPQIKDNEYAEEITLLSSRWNGLSKENTAGTAEAAQIRQERAKITRDLLQFIKKLGQSY
ncbi:MAG: GTP-binding protein [Candidatus Aminicenantes bacterium]|nr:GTP-binding protein [Candidatus Aminicenantes bacterium]